MILLAIATAGIWVYLLLGRGGFWRMREEPAPGMTLSAAPRIVAVIPARNEADVVGKSIASLARQQYPGDFHIVLVDDDSTDGTADAARIAAPADRLTVVRAAALPSGWTGKLWAVSEGVRQAPFEPDYYLLTDADIVHPPETLAALVARSATGDYDLVSYMATLRCRTMAERTLIPAFVFFFFLLYPPDWIRNPRRGTAGAAGGCMLIRRTALEGVGGIPAIAGELIDDCALARAVKRNHGQVWLGLSAGTLSIRDYTSFGEIESMISRTAFTQLHHSALLLLGTVLGLAITYLAPPILTVAARGWPAGIGAVAWFMMSAAYLPAVRCYRQSPLWAPLLPLIAAFYMGATVHSAVAYWRGTGGRWKGRVQDRDS